MHNAYQSPFNTNCTKHPFSVILLTILNKITISRSGGVIIFYNGHIYVQT